MNEEKLKDLMALQTNLTKFFKEEAAFSQTDAVKELDGLNSDLLMTELNAVNALVGILSIRIGLNMNALQQKLAEQQKASGDQIPAEETPAVNDTTETETQA